VNGAVGAVATSRGRPVTERDLTATDGKIVKIGAIADPERARRIASAVPRHRPGLA
jgi:hypothetical protein